MGSSPGFGSNPDNTAGIVAARPLDSSRKSAHLNVLQAPEGTLAQGLRHLGLPPQDLPPPAARPIRTRFRFGSGTHAP